MNLMISISLDWLDWLHLFQHYLLLSLLGVGGATTTLPEMHRFLVGEHHWLTETQFNASLAIAHASPGPNVLFIALFGWNVGMNSGNTVSASAMAGLLGVVIAMTGILLPSSALTYWVAAWLRRNSALRSVRAFKQGLAPIVIALLVATGWIMASTHSFSEWRLWAVTIFTALLVWRTRVHMMWLIGGGALLGWLDYI